MRIRIWGSRGSLATPGPETVRYGGNTSCVEVSLQDGTTIVLDAGTGIRALGSHLAVDPPKSIHLLLTHLHMDHLEGLGFFGPLYDPETELNVWGPPSHLRTLEQRIARYLSPPLFPVHVGDVPRAVFHDAPEEEWQIGTARITASPVAHPGPTLGYRLEENGHSFVYIPDHEPALGLDLSTVSPDWVSGFGLAYGADLLFHDAQYFEDEYESRRGWGHSSVSDAVTFAMISKVRRFVMFHHDPQHADDVLEALKERAKALWGPNGEGPELAYEGMELELT